MSCSRISLMRSRINYFNADGDQVGTIGSDPIFLGGGEGEGLLGDLQANYNVFPLETLRVLRYLNFFFF